MKNYKIVTIRSIKKKKRKKDRRKIIGYSIYYWDIVRWRYEWTYTKYKDAIKFIKTCKIK